MQKNGTRPSSHQTSINSELIEDFDLDNPYQLLRESIEKTGQNADTGKTFCKTLIAQKMTARTDQWDGMEFKSFGTAKDL